MPEPAVLRRILLVDISEEEAIRYAIERKAAEPQEYDGYGIGLAACQKIVDRHGGSITARNRPGEGATFIITLQVRHPPTGQGELR